MTTLQDFSGISCELSRIKVLASVIGSITNGCVDNLEADDAGALVDILEDRLAALEEAVDRLDREAQAERREASGLPPWPRPVKPATPPDDAA